MPKRKALRYDSEESEQGDEGEESEQGDEGDEGEESEEGEEGEQGDEGDESEESEDATLKRPSHCPSCGESMETMACSIDFHAIYVCQLVRSYMEKHGEIPDQKTLEHFDAISGSDPCDDCCCGACGSRKEYPGQAHC